MLGQLYERALDGERCWIRYHAGDTAGLPVRQWLGNGGADQAFDDALVARCVGPTIELGCGPGRLVSALCRRGIPAIGIDQSPTAIRLAWRRGAPALLGDVFGPIPGAGYWHTVLVADGSIGLGGDPRRLLGRSAALLHPDGRCVVEFDSAATGIRIDRMRLESVRESGPWFRWASVGLDSAAQLAEQAGLALGAVHRVGARALAILLRR